MKTPFQTIIGQVYRIADAILTDKQRPKKQIGLGWQYEQTSEGYYALRLRGLHE
ncbi:hypothetical protein D3C87_1371490 [compost metagenome]